MVPVRAATRRARAARSATAPGGLRRLRDRTRPGLRVLFVGINPGIRSATIGHHYAGYSNRFWKLLRDSNLVPVLLTCEQDVRLPEWGYGLTNLVARPTRGIGDLTRDEYAAGRRTLLRKINRFRPEVVALVGVTLHHVLFPRKARDRSAAREPLRLGLQAGDLHGARVFVLPNPSGRNANFSYAQILAAFRSLKDNLDRSPTKTEIKQRGSRSMTPTPRPKTPPR